MRVNGAGIAIIKKFEGCKLKAYRCPAGVLTIGYGHTGPDVHDGKKITEDEAEALLRADLEKFEEGVTKLIGAMPVTENQFSALVSLAYNIGLGNLKASSPLMYHKAKNYKQAAISFGLWNKANGKVLKGLERRRKAEADLYATP